MWCSWRRRCSNKKNPNLRIWGKRDANDDLSILRSSTQSPVRGGHGDRGDRDHAPPLPLARWAVEENGEHRGGLSLVGSSRSCPPFIHPCPPFIHPSTKEHLQVASSLVFKISLHGTLDNLDGRPVEGFVFLIFLASLVT